MNQISRAEDFIGFSTDDRPSSGIEDGATYHAVDTGEMWVFYNSMWMLDLHPARFIHSPLMLP